ncbi:MAG: carboxypeptidase-like regulatory domain-containing protein [Cyclobacteriaceae bacterium]
MRQILVVALFLISISGYSQTVSGFVVDEENTPIIGAQVMESGFRNGTTTNIDGSFVLTLNSPNSNLIFSFVGYETDSLLLQHGEVSQIVLKEASSSMDYISMLADYRVLLILIWAVICILLVLRTFRGVPSA